MVAHIPCCFAFNVILCSTLLRTSSLPYPKENYPLVIDLSHDFGSSYFIESGRYKLQSLENLTYDHKGGNIITNIQGFDSCGTSNCKSFCFENTDGVCYEGVNKNYDRPPTVLMNCTKAGPQTCTDAEYVTNTFHINHTKDFMIKAGDEIPEIVGNNDDGYDIKIIILLYWLAIVTVVVLIVVLAFLPKKVKSKVCPMFWANIQDTENGINKDPEEPFIRANDPGMKVIEPSEAITDEKLDDFVAFVHSCLEKHPISNADNLMALKLGSTTYDHYNSYQNQPVNMARSTNEKVKYLLTYWMHTSIHQSMDELVEDLNEKLSSEPSFNLIRQQIKQRFIYSVNSNTR